MSRGPPFFVLHLSERHERPDERARFVVQLLDEVGQAIERCYLDEHGTPLARCPFLVSPEVLAAAVRQEAGRGDYVDDEGRSVRAF